MILNIFIKILKKSEYKSVWVNMSVGIIFNIAKYPAINIAKSYKHSVKTILRTRKKFY